MWNFKSLAISSIAVIVSIVIKSYGFPASLIALQTSRSSFSELTLILSAETKSEPCSRSRIKLFSSVDNIVVLPQFCYPKSFLSFSSLCFHKVQHIFSPKKASALVEELYSVRQVHPLCVTVTNYIIN